MSLFRTLDSSETQLAENNIILRNRNAPVGMMNAFGKMGVQYKPELGGIAMNSQMYLDSLVEMEPRDMQFLTRSANSEFESETMPREMKMQTYVSPISPLSPLDCIGVSESPAFHNYYSQHQGSETVSFHGHGPPYNRTALTGSFVSGSGQGTNIPFTQRMDSFEKYPSSDNLRSELLSSFPHFHPGNLSIADVQGSIFSTESSDCIRQRLQELERELFTDDESSILSSIQDFGKEWTDNIEGYVLEDLIVHSPMESTNERGYSNCDKNCQHPTNATVQAGSEEHSTCQSQSGPPSQEAQIPSDTKELDARTQNSPKELLYQCAAAVADDKVDLALQLISNLRQLVSIHGDPMQRLAGYMVEGLAARIASSGQGLYKALRCKEAPSSDMLSAMQILFEVCPYFKFGYMAANFAICECFKNEQRVHIIDFEVGQGAQHMSLIDSFAKRPGGPPQVCITGIDDLESTKRSDGGLQIVGKRLEQYAETKGVPLQFIPIAQKVADIQAQVFDIRPGEALAVNFAFQLHHMPDESVSIKNPRDQLLRLVKSLNPKIVTVVEQEVNTNTSPFLTRFMEALDYYSSVFESLDATLPRESKDRLNVEKQCLARDIVNVIACEGVERIERYEVAGKWKARMTMAGFTMYPFGSYVKESIKRLLQSYCDNYQIKEEGGAMYFGWLEKALIVASAWH
eukprot:TRINITY_DN3825_c0_g1_i1.p1 TRINITY_DN3825_c0_g1~~TRINITY_DN3825_c0_g1_i1.p1  ORF type:complete len:686 (-),score=134.32 TRINITY_DN3825_c0_g1_i1:6-2063(-)